MKNVKNIVVLVLLGGVIGGCGKDSSFPNATNSTYSSGICRVATMSYINPLFSDTVFDSFEYNFGGKIAKITDYVNGKYNGYWIYDYSTNGIVDVKYFLANGTLNYHFIYLLGSNGYPSSQIIDDDNQHDTIFYEYNADKYLIKKIDHRLNKIYTYTITNGNVSQAIIKNIYDTTTYKITYEYTDKPDKLGNLAILLGKGNANLVSKEIEYGKNEVITTYSYTFDRKGYPLEVILTSSFWGIPLTLKENYTYTCP